jgi:flagellar basal body-associated protein FliL
MTSKRLNKTFILIIVLILLLIVALSYIGFSIYSDWSNQEKGKFYQQGAQYGYEQALRIIYQQALSCQPVPLTVDNSTINLIASECLQKVQ